MKRLGPPVETAWAPAGAPLPLMACPGFLGREGAAASSAPTSAHLSCNTAGHDPALLSGLPGPLLHALTNDMPPCCVHSSMAAALAGELRRWNRQQSAVAAHPYTGADT